MEVRGIFGLLEFHFVCSLGRDSPQLSVMCGCQQSFAPSNLMCMNPKYPTRGTDGRRQSGAGFAWVTVRQISPGGSST
jgi:hypothetical protein